MIYTSGNLTIDNGVWTNKKSIGKLNVYKDGDTSSPNITIDSSDFDTLASQISATNNKVDTILSDIAAAPNSSLASLNAGDVTLSPNGLIKSSSKLSSSIGTPFTGYLASKVNVDCSGATVMADNLSEGVTAYDSSGNLITGNGKDNEIYMKENAQELIVPLYNSTKEITELSELNIQGETSAYRDIPLTYVGDDGYLYVLSSVSTTLYCHSHGASGIGGGGRSLWATPSSFMTVSALDSEQSEIPYGTILNATGNITGRNVSNQLGYRQYDNILEVFQTDISLNLFETPVPYGTSYLRLTTRTQHVVADDGYSHYEESSNITGTKATYLKLDMKSATQ